MYYDVLYFTALNFHCFLADGDASAVLWSSWLRGILIRWQEQKVRSAICTLVTWWTISWTIWRAVRWGLRVSWQRCRGSRIDCHRGKDERRLMATGCVCAALCCAVLCVSCSSPASCMLSLSRLLQCCIHLTLSAPILLCRPEVSNLSSKFLFTLHPYCSSHSFSFVCSLFAGRGAWTVWLLPQVLSEPWRCEWRRESSNAERRVGWHREGPAQRTEDARSSFSALPSPVSLSCIVLSFVHCESLHNRSVSSINAALLKWHNSNLTSSSQDLLHARSSWCACRPSSFSRKGWWRGRIDPLKPSLTILSVVLRNAGQLGSPLSLLSLSHTLNAIWNHVKRYNVMWYDVMWYHVVWYHGMWYNWIWYHVMWYHMIWWDGILCIVISWDVISCDMIGYDMIGYDIM